MFNERLHRRDSDGKFSGTGAGTGGAEKVISRENGGPAVVHTKTGRAGKAVKPAGLPGNARAVKGTDGQPIGWSAVRQQDTAQYAAGSRSAAGFSRRKAYRAYRPDGTDLGLDFYHPDDVRRGLERERRG